MPAPDPAPIEMLGSGATACRLYRDAPSWQGLRTAAVGGFRCETAAAGAALLAEAAALLAREGFAALIGPMDGDTWHSYRLVTESDGSPPFFLEPQGGPHDRAAFEQAGFAPVARYVSARAPVPGPEARLAPAKGISVAAWDGTGAEILLEHLFGLSLSAFARNAFYRPIGREAFRALYLPLLPRLDPRLVLLARDAAGGVCAFLLAFPDFLAGTAPPAAIIKTYASLRHGAGRMLLEQAHLVARDLGFREVIHALMHEDNISRRGSERHGGRVFRRYALMGRRLGP
ncbi:MAG: hypothetical protein IT557_18200 [Alphaproteobacteria bacterium]|nr:hypothetical protein [Alphaproteobacteria bacterium]